MTLRRIEDKAVLAEGQVDRGAVRHAALCQSCAVLQQLAAERKGLRVGRDVVALVQHELDSPDRVGATNIERVLTDGQRSGGLAAQAANIDAHLVRDMRRLSSHDAVCGKSWWWRGLSGLSTRV